MEMIRHGGQRQHGLCGQGRERGWCGAHGKHSYFMLSSWCIDFSSFLMTQIAAGAFTSLKYSARVLCLVKALSRFFNYCLRLYPFLHPSPLRAHLCISLSIHESFLLWKLAQLEHGSNVKGSFTCLFSWPIPTGEARVTSAAVLSTVWVVGDKIGSQVCPLHRLFVIQNRSERSVSRVLWRGAHDNKW